MDEDLKKQYYNHRKEDILDRKISAFERIFDKFFFAAGRDIKVFFIVILVCSNIYTLWMYVQSQESRVIDSQEYAERIIDEATRRLRPEIDREVERKTEQIERKVDNASNTLDQIQEEISKTIKESLQ